LVGDFLDGLDGVFAAFHFECALWYGEGIGDAPVAGGVHPDVIGAVGFEDIDSAVWRAFAFGVKGHACPEAGVFHDADGVFFDVVDDDFGAIEFGKVREGIDDDAGAFELVLEVGCVDEDWQVIVEGDLDVFLEDFEFGAGVFVEADFTDAEDVWLCDELGDQGHDFASEAGVIGFLRIDAKP